jgi:hypothetical protein
VYVQSRVFNALLQSSAAKHAATQKAMKSASDNADKLITDYTVIVCLFRCGLDAVAAYLPDASASAPPTISAICWVISA